jgi:hypothetical protein
VGSAASLLGLGWSMSESPIAHGVMTSLGVAAAVQVLEVLAGGGASLIQWKLQTGRTHQIRWVGGAVDCAFAQGGHGCTRHVHTRSVRSLRGEW